MKKTIENLIQEIISLINNQNFELAKSKTERLISTNKNNDVLYNLLGIINLKLNEMQFFKACPDSDAQASLQLPHQKNQSSCQVPR